MGTQKAANVQAVLDRWCAHVAQSDLWPRALHHGLISAAAAVLPDGSRSERAELRVLAVESLHAVGNEDKHAARRSVCGRLAALEQWEQAKPSADAVMARFSAASQYAEAY